MTALASELHRRESNTEKVLAVFLAHPSRWLHWRRFEAVGGSCAWRTRISDARKIVERGGGRIDHNHGTTRSAYRYIPAASEPSPDRWPVFGAPAYEEPWKLTSESPAK